MAYILQHRRDTAANWEAVNPILADAEIGYVLDKDENGKQKSSLYKIGDGKTAWNDLPYFGFNGNVYNDFEGDDLATSVASRQAVSNELDKKLNTEQLVQDIARTDEELNIESEILEEMMRNQTVSRYAINSKFQETNERLNQTSNTVDELDKDINGYDVESDGDEPYHVDGIKDQINLIGHTLDSTSETISGIQKDLTENDEMLKQHSDFLNGWTEKNPETEEVVATYLGVVKEIYGDVVTNHNGLVKDVYGENGIIKKTEKLPLITLMSQEQFDSLSSYTPNTLYFLYEGD